MGTAVRVESGWRFPAGPRRRIAGGVPLGEGDSDDGQGGGDDVVDDVRGDEDAEPGGDGAAAGPGGRPAQQHRVPDEDDADFVNGIWVQATQGKTARAVEEEAMVDGYRIFRLFEHWVHEGALEQKAETQ